MNGVVAAYLAGGLSGAIAYAIAQSKQGKPAHTPTEAELLASLKEIKPLLTKTFNIDVSQARTNQEFVISGQSIFVLNPEIPTVPVQIRLNEPNTELLDLTQTRHIQAPFYQFFITNAVGVGVLTFIVNKVSTVELEPATLNINIVAQTANIDVNLAAQTVDININIAAQTVTVNINVASSGIMLPVDIQAQYITLDTNVKQWGGTAVTGANVTTYLARLNVNLSTVATQTTLASVLARLNVNLSTVATQTTLAGVLTQLDVPLSALIDPVISQSTPENLKHVPHGYYASGSVYKPLAVDVNGVLLISNALGDMLKAVYDTNDNGVVDNSEKLEGSTKVQVQTHNPAEHGNEAHDPDFIKVEEITTVASDATPTPTGGSLRNFYTITALAINATFAAPSGTPANANRLIVRIKDNGTARTLGWNAIYRALEFALPTTTEISKTMYLGFIYNSADSKWDMVAINEEA